MTGLAAFESLPPWTTRDPLSTSPRIWIGVWSSLNWRLGVDGYAIVPIYGKEGVVRDNPDKAVVAMAAQLESPEP